MSTIAETQDINHVSLLRINDAVGRRSLLHRMPGAWLLNVPPQPERATVSLTRMIRNRNLSNCVNVGLFFAASLPMLMVGRALPFTQVRRLNLLATIKYDIFCCYRPCVPPADADHM